PHVVGDDDRPLRLQRLDHRPPDRLVGERREGAAPARVEPLAGEQEGDLTLLDQIVPVEPAADEPAGDLPHHPLVLHRIDDAGGTGGGGRDRGCCRPGYDMHRRSLRWAARIIASACSWTLLTCDSLTPSAAAAALQVRQS